MRRSSPIPKARRKYLKRLRAYEKRKLKRIQEVEDKLDGIVRFNGYTWQTFKTNYSATYPVPLNVPISTTAIGKTITWTPTKKK